MEEKNAETNPYAQSAVPFTWVRALRMLSNLDYGREVDVESWRLPELKARPADAADRELAVRLTDAFYCAMEAGGGTGDGIWSNLSDKFHGPFIASLEARDYDQIATTLSGMFYAPIATGICRRSEDPAQLAADPMQRLQTADVCASLGMALGLVMTPNPATPEPPNAIEYDCVQILEKVADHLGWNIAPPQAGGVFGVEFKGQLIPFKHLYQIYMASRIQSLFNGSAGSCLEIGGGVGFLAYACVANKVATDYCIIDLPLVNMMQGYLLLKSDQAEYVELFGEKPNTDRERRIRIFPDAAVPSLKSQSFDIAVNQDSFPEMDAATMNTYVSQLKRVVRSYVLSINHESSGGTRQVKTAMGKSSAFEAVYRMPYWMRPGYMEELFSNTTSQHPLRKIWYSIRG